MKRADLMILCLAGCLLLHCSSGTVAGIETQNGGSVKTACSALYGSAPAGTQVYLTPRSSIPGTPEDEQSLVTVVSADRRYRFDSLPADTYAVFFTTPSSRRGAQVSDVAVAAELIDTARTFTLRPTGSISGTISQTDNDSGHVLIYARGTPFYAVGTGGDSFTLSGMPPGRYTLIAVPLVFGATGHLPTVTVPEDRPTVQVHAGRETTIGEIDVAE